MVVRLTNHRDARSVRGLSRLLIAIQQAELVWSSLNLAQRCERNDEIQLWIHVVSSVRRTARHFSEFESDADGQRIFFRILPLI